jgi:hypothetical protein
MLGGEHLQVISQILAVWIVRRKHRSKNRAGDEQRK